MNNNYYELPLFIVIYRVDDLMQDMYIFIKGVLLS